MDALQINERVKNAKKVKIKVYPCNNLRASNIGHPCERYLYLLIKHWEEQSPHDVGLQNIFDLGTHLESHAVNALKEAGYEVVSTKINWKIDNPKITGREDIRIKDEDTEELLPAEIKWLSPNEYSRLNTQRDFKYSKRHYVRAYPAQLLVYMYYFEKERGFFILGNKLTGEVKAIDVRLDWDYADELLKKAERIYAALGADDIDACRRTEDYNICDKCSLAHMCGAEIIRVETDVDVEEELASLIDERKSLSDAKSRYDEIQDEMKRLMDGKSKVISGRYVVERRAITRAAYEAKETTYDRLFVMDLSHE